MQNDQTSRSAKWKGTKKNQILEAVQKKMVRISLLKLETQIIRKIKLHNVNLHTKSFSYNSTWVHFLKAKLIILNSHMEFGFKVTTSYVHVGFIVFNLFCYSECRESRAASLCVYILMVMNFSGNWRHFKLTFGLFH